MNICTLDLKADWIFLGDYSRYIFLSKLIDDNSVMDFKDSSIWVSHGNNLSVADNYCCITTNKYFPDIRIFVPGNNYDMSKLPLKRDTRILVFEEFPFIKESTQKILSAIGNVISLIVLVNSYKFSASTDLTRKGEDFESAKQWYLEKNMNVLWINDLNNSKELQNIFYWRPRLRDYYKKQAEIDLDRLKECTREIKYDYELIYEDWRTDNNYLLNRKQIYSYNAVKKSSKYSIWYAYMNEAYDKLFSKNKNGKIYDVIDLYEEVMNENNLIVWDLNKDKEKLLNKLQIKYRNVLEEPVKYRGLRSVISTFFIKNETDYLKLITDSKSKFGGIHVDFLKQLDIYIEKGIPEVLQLFLEDKYIKLEEIIMNNNGLEKEEKDLSRNMSKIMEKLKKHVNKTYLNFIGEAK